MRESRYSQYQRKREQVEKQTGLGTSPAWASVASVKSEGVKSSFLSSPADGKDDNSVINTMTKTVYEAEKAKNEVVATVRVKDDFVASPLKTKKKKEEISTNATIPSSSLPPPPTADSSFLLLTVPSFVVDDTGFLKYQVHCSLCRDGNSNESWFVLRSFAEFRDLKTLMKRSVTVSAPFPPSNGSHVDSGSGRATSREHAREMLSAYVEELSRAIGHRIATAPEGGSRTDGLASHLKAFASFSSGRYHCDRRGVDEAANIARKSGKCLGSLDSESLGQRQKQRQARQQTTGKESRGSSASLSPNWKRVAGSPLRTDQTRRHWSVIPSTNSKTKSNQTTLVGSLPNAISSVDIAIKSSDSVLAQTRRSQSLKSSSSSSASFSARSFGRKSSPSRASCRSDSSIPPAFRHRSVAATKTGSWSRRLSSSVSPPRQRHSTFSQAYSRNTAAASQSPGAFTPTLSALSESRIYFRDKKRHYSPCATTGNVLFASQIGVDLSLATRGPCKSQVGSTALSMAESPRSSSSRSPADASPKKTFTALKNVKTAREALLLFDSAHHDLVPNHIRVDHSSSSSKCGKSSGRSSDDEEAESPVSDERRTRGYFPGIEKTELMQHLQPFSDQDDGPHQASPSRTKSGKPDAAEVTASVRNSDALQWSPATPTPLTTSHIPPAPMITSAAAPPKTPVKEDIPHDSDNDVSAIKEQSMQKSQAKKQIMTLRQKLLLQDCVQHFNLPSHIQASPPTANESCEEARGPNDVSSDIDDRSSNRLQYAMSKDRKPPSLANTAHRIIVSARKKVSPKKMAKHPSEQAILVAAILSEDKDQHKNLPPHMLANFAQNSQNSTEDRSYDGSPA